MGLFSRNTMDPTDMSRLAGYCALMILLNHHYQGYWPERERMEFIRHWLKKSRHRAPVPTLEKLADIGERVARRYQEERPAELEQLIESKDAGLSEQLMERCRKEMKKQGLH